MGPVPPTGKSAIARRRCGVTNRVDKIRKTKAGIAKTRVSPPAIGPVLAIGLGLSLLCGAVYAAGVYEDTAGETAFLYAPQKRAFFPRIVRTNENEKDASIFVLSSSFPLRPYLLVDLEQPFIALSSPGEIKNGFGDLKLRARARLYNRGGRAFRLTGSFRTGSGTRSLFPYSSQSADVGVGLSYVDTLETFNVWGAVGGVVVKRKPPNLLPPDVHDNYGQASAGLTLPVTPDLVLSAGLTVLLFRGGASREIYLCSVAAGLSKATSLIVAVHAEAGKREERVSDLAVTGGVRVFY